MCAASGSGFRHPWRRPDLLDPGALTLVVIGLFLASVGSFVAHRYLLAAGVATTFAGLLDLLLHPDARATLLAAALALLASLAPYARWRPTPVDPTTAAPPDPSAVIGQRGLARGFTGTQGPRVGVVALGGVLWEALAEEPIPDGAKVVVVASVDGRPLVARDGPP